MNSNNYYSNKKFYFAPFNPDFTFEDYDALDGESDLHDEITHWYVIRRLTQLPENDNISKTLKVIRHHHPILLRERATQIYNEELKWLEGRYSPNGFHDYEKSKGIGYNISLCLEWNEPNYGPINHLLVNTSLEDFQDRHAEARKKEAAIFEAHGWEYPEEYK